MSVERVWEWTCDACSVVERRRSSGFPRGWVYVVVQGRTEHRCAMCAAQIPPAQRGYPQEIADA